MNKNKLVWAGIAAVGLVTASCAGLVDGGDASRDEAAKAIEVMKSSFKPSGQAGLDRIDQDETQRLCTKYHAGVPMPAEVAQRIQGEQQATLK